MVAASTLIPRGARNPNLPAWASSTCANVPPSSGATANSAPLPDWELRLWLRCLSKAWITPSQNQVKKDKPKKIKLLLVDAHPIVLDGIKSHLCAQPDFEVVGDASNGQEALRKAKLTMPDVVLMDISMPHMNGLEAMADRKSVV